MKEPLEDPKFEAAMTKAVKTNFVNSTKRKKELAGKIKEAPKKEKK